MKELTVSEIIKNKGIMLHKGKINLVVAPAGSGKTYYIFNELVDDTKKSVYLCDTSNLKEMILKDEDIIGKVKGTDFELLHGFELNKYNCTVMTYAKWFYVMDKPEYQDVETIICDEIHNAYKYKDRFDREANEEKGIEECKNYENVINNLHKNAKRGVQVVGFTATHNRIKKDMGNLLPNKDSHITSSFNSDWNVINLSNEKNIKRLKEDFTYKYSNYKNLSYHLNAFNGFKLGQKALIYTDRISTALDMVDIASKCNLKSVALWSMSNKKHIMNEEQLKVRESILKDGLIPDDVDVLIINSSYETGINIKNDNVELVIVNSTDEDTQIQARSRIRKNIKALFIKSNNMIDDIKVTVPDDYLNRALTKKDKEELVKELNIVNENSRMLKWTSIKPIIINSGYDIKDGRIRIEKTLTRIDIINKNDMFI